MTFATASMNGAAEVSCEPMCICTPLDLEVRILGGGLIGGGGHGQRDAELVLALAGGDLGVGLGVDVRG